MRLENSFIQIDGIGSRLERRLWNAGTTEWAGGIDPDILGPTRTERVNRFADQAEEALGRNDVEFFASRLPRTERWRLAETFLDRVTALDIETTGLDPTRDRVTMVTLDGPDGTRTLVRGQELTGQRIQRELLESDLLLTYNGARFDLPFLEERFDLEIDIPHLDLLPACRRLDWTGGLSAVESRLGIERDLPDVDGREAVRLWYRYRDGDDDALERLIRYNREDTTLLIEVLEEVIAALDRQVFDPHVPQRVADGSVRTNIR